MLIDCVSAAACRLLLLLLLVLLLFSFDLPLLLLRGCSILAMAGWLAGGIPSLDVAQEQ